MSKFDPDTEWDKRLFVAITEARRFIARAERSRARPYCGRRTAAAKRASMDLSTALVWVRKSRWLDPEA